MSFFLFFFLQHLLRPNPFSLDLKDILTKSSICRDNSFTVLPLILFIGRMPNKMTVNQFNLIGNTGGVAGGWCTGGVAGGGCTGGVAGSCCTGGVAGGWCTGSRCVEGAAGGDCTGGAAYGGCTGGYVFRT